MIMNPINSSNLKSVGYDKDNLFLFITFHSGDTYRYSGIPLSVYEGLLNASSKGSYHHNFIKKYPYIKV